MRGGEHRAGPGDDSMSETQDRDTGRGGGGGCVLVCAGGGVDRAGANGDDGDDGGAGGPARHHTREKALPIKDEGSREAELMGEYC